MNKNLASVLMIVGIWFSAAIGSFATKNANPFDYAFLSTLLIGVGYFVIILKDKIKS